MKKILKVDNPNDYGSRMGSPVLHPLLSIVNFDEVSPVHNSLNHYGVYGLFMQREFPGNLLYGTRTLSQVSDASIIAVMPGQLGGGEDNGQLLMLSGWAVLWSPELVHNSDLEQRMGGYRFFSYFFTDALRMKAVEWDAISRLVGMMRDELTAHDDTPAQRAVLVSYLRLILDYCDRIYRRQLTGRENDSSDILKRFDALLERYFDEGRQLRDGLPTVTFCASQLAHSPHYFGDLVKQATGSTAINHIHHYVINRGKSLLMSGRNITETAHLLGFDYPHHFTRLFKKIVGLTPTGFIGKNRNNP